MRLLNVAQIANLLQVGKSTVWLWVRQGKLPKPIKLAAKTTRWRESEVIEAVEKLARENS